MLPEGTVPGTGPSQMHHSVLLGEYQALLRANLWRLAGHGAGKEDVPFCGKQDAGKLLECHGKLLSFQGMHGKSRVSNKWAPLGRKTGRTDAGGGDGVLNFLSHKCANCRDLTTGIF